MDNIFKKCIIDLEAIGGNTNGRCLFCKPGNFDNKIGFSGFTIFKSLQFKRVHNMVLNRD
jgi:hypothetical protein